MRHSLGEPCISGTIHGLSRDLLDEYSAELRSLGEQPSSREDERLQERRKWLIQIVADLRDGAMTPTVLVAIQERGRNSDRQA
jgi:hypothetical protein